MFLHEKFGKMKIVLLLCVFLPFGFAQDVTTTPTIPSTSNYFTQVPSTLLPCPCFGQPEGIVIPHPSDCRAYYTCMGGLDVRQSKCTNHDQFFHPYIRSCVKRTTFVSFVPDFIPTKDLCKITSVFPAPAMENFDNCNIKSDETVVDANSDELLSLIRNKNIPVSTTVPAGLGGIFNLFPWTSNRNTVSENIVDSNTVMSYQTYTTEMPTQMGTAKITDPIIMTSTTTSSKAETNCKVAKVIVHHFPGPCKADITCENGATLTIDKCQSSLNVVPL